MENDHTSDTQEPGGDPRPEALESAIARYVERLTRGESLDRLDILAENPGIGDTILQALQQFVDLHPASQDSASLGTLGDYTLRGEIGRGGMGVVYDAWQNSMDRRVALKVLPRALAADSRAATRFIREAQIAGKLDHPNVVHVHGTGIEEQVPYYAMEFVEGETLAQILARIADAEPQTETAFGKKDSVVYFGRLADAFADAADGLQHAHSRGVTHRDIKPSNLILDSGGRLRILDFGLARLEGQESLTFSGDVVGTPVYMSPEQAQRKKSPVDHRTDVYSLGATVYEASCGRPPFRGRDHAETLTQIIERDPVEPRKINQSVPKDLETIVLKCLREEAADRYGTAEALGQDLRRFVRGEVVEARPQSGFEKLVRRLWRHRRAVAVAAGLVSLAFAALVVSVILVWRAKARTDAALGVAQHNLEVADAAVGELLNWAGDRRFVLSPQAEPIRRTLLERALEFHEAFVAENPENPKILLRAADTEVRVGQIYQLVGQVSEARTAYHRAVRSLTRLIALTPDAAENATRLADVQSLLALLDSSGLPGGGAAVRRYPVGGKSRNVVDVAIADFDRDGLRDIAALNRHSADLRILWNSGGREFELSESRRVGRDPLRLALADLDGDQDPDLVTMNRQEWRLSVVLNEAERRFADAVHVDVGYTPWDIAAADFDGDGRDEVAVVGLDLGILDRQPDGAYVVSGRFAIKGFPNSIVAGDVDGDGDTDLVVGSHENLEGFLLVLSNDGLGRFSTAATVPCPSIPLRLVAGEFNGDGSLDLAASDDPESGHLFVALNTGDGRFAPGVKYPVGRQHMATAAADLDGDGNTDVVTTYERDGAVSLFLSDGHGRFPSVARLLSGGYAFRGDAADLDGDGQVDLALANGFADDVAVLYHARELVGKTARELPAPVPSGNRKEREDGDPDAK